ncbi:hypothetical protein ACW14X_28035 [Nocardioides sp. YJ-D4]
MSTEPAQQGDERDSEPAPLAVHRDPSRQLTESRPTQISKSGVAWVRPSDLPTLLGGRLIGRGLDLKADLVRRANRRAQPLAPRPRTSRTAIADTQPPSITHRTEGISL